MRIIFLLRQDAFIKAGGDTLQVKKYVEELNRIGVYATISVNVSPDLTNFDIVHLVNIDRPLETWHHFKRAKRYGKRIVISPIHHSYVAIDLYEKMYRSGMLAYFNSVFRSYSAREKLKSLYRGFVYPELMLPAMSLIFSSLAARQKRILECADKWLVIANGELDLIKSDFRVTPRSSTVIYNGIDLHLARCAASTKEYDVLVVGRIEARKNQVKILRALAGTSLRVAFAGSVNQFHKAYVEEFLREISEAPNAVYLGPVPYEQMPELYGKSRVHVSASWFEVASLADLEALYYGCNIVSSRNGFTYEYAGDHAYYVTPGDEGDIRDKVMKALETSYDESLPEYVARKFTWERAALQLRDAYDELLKTPL